MPSILTLCWRVILPAEDYCLSFKLKWRCVLRDLIKYECLFEALFPGGRGRFKRVDVLETVC